MEEAYFDSDKLSDYLGEKLFCREERQYAALLYSLFLKKMRNEKIGEEAEVFIRRCLECGEDVAVEDVYFEATIMRDFFRGDHAGKKTFNRKLYNDPLEDEIFDVEKLRSIKQNYEELCPGIPDRTRQRDFTVLRNIGYPIEYIRRYRYYNAWDSTNFRDNFGLFLEDGILKRRRGGTDHEDQHISAEEIAFRESWLREMEE